MVSLPQTPIYEARASIEIEAANDNYLDLRDVNPTEGAGRGGEVDIATHAQALKTEFERLRVWLYCDAAFSRYDDDRKQRRQLRKVG